jgi:peptidoglycan/LPS O-acetylase OafA/YrhL
MTTVSSARGAGPTHRLSYIDAVRGFAALWVFVLHIHGYWLDNVRPSTLSLDGLVVKSMAFGGAGVDIFIVLSGFCLTLPLLRGGPGQLSGMDTKGFFRRRAYRLLPAYFAALALVMALELVPRLRPHLVARDLGWWDLVTHVTLTFPFFQETLGSVNGSLWSISLEATLYLGFPVLLVLHRWKGMRAVLSATVLVALVWAVFSAFWRGSSLHPELLPELDKLFPARWVQFALGMWAATIVRHPKGGELRWALPLLAIAAPLGVFAYVRGVDLLAVLA